MDSVATSLGFWLGTDADGRSVRVTIDEIPHLLVAGTSGSGKSVFLNNLIYELLGHPKAQVRLLLLDPKRVEFTLFRDAPQLVAPPISEPDEMIAGLEWLVNQMETRYRILQGKGLRDARSLNLPAIVCVIDELANLVLTDKRTEPLLVTLASLGRAACIHLVAATQSPRADILTGLLKANIPARIAFATVSALESRIILDQPGAEDLHGHGDMLARVPQGLLRLQGVMRSDDEIRQAVATAKGVA
jgi:S-DNA-T family DNA segregation ATPase FtsK/SpoIIIE